MTKQLIIVESPTKAKAIKKYMGSAFQVKASVGHVKDLPVSKLGVDVENDFEPTYQIIKGKKKVVDELVAAAKDATDVFLATDPDREGEAIAWHVAEEIEAGCKKPEAGKKKGPATKKIASKKPAKKSGPNIHRVLFHEITPAAVREAISKPVAIDKNLFEAQQARRILDRLVGYKISPILWNKVQRGLSAGRVQSVAVRIICEREAAIKKFKPEEYWSIVAHLEGSIPPQFEAKLLEAGGKKIDITNKKDADSILTGLKRSDFILSKITKQERRRHPVPPFTTSKLQQEAARKLGFSAKKTMMMAQQLYEGIDLGGNLVGLITYMRTDSVRVADSAIQSVREHIAAKYGKETLPKGPNFYKNKKGAQDAHEAVRPTSFEFPPDEIKGFLEKDQYRLYDLIWKRFVASQMNSAIYDQTIFDIKATDFMLRSTGQVMKFPGFMSVYLEGIDEEAEKDEEENPTLPDLKEGEKLKLHGLDPNQHFTQPPPRFTEASLVKELEEQGIGRPSTYASIMSVIQDKEYVKKLQLKFHPTRLGEVVNELLVTNFPEILDVKFTAQMEEELDDIEEGKMKWNKVLNDFYVPFAKTLKRAEKTMVNLKAQAIETKIMCEKCGKPMVIKWGRHGEFLACSTYPECKSTKEFSRSETGEITPKAAETTDEKCEKCGADMVIKRGRFGKFLACSKYPECKTTKTIGIGVKCPECGGDVVSRMGKRGRAFYGCSKYPNCK
ncbi:MAG: DNA topoisomerase I, partial [Deltaproteobacteria bacterium CG11_big_fil_rev_8_21_14_0_20_49_13]